MPRFYFITSIVVILITSCSISPMSASMWQLRADKRAILEAGHYSIGEIRHNMDDRLIGDILIKTDQNVFRLVLARPSRATEIEYRIIAGLSASQWFSLRESSKVAKGLMIALARHFYELTGSNLNKIRLDELHLLKKGKLEQQLLCIACHQSLKRSGNSVQNLKTVSGGGGVRVQKLDR